MGRILKVMKWLAVSVIGLVLVLGVVIGLWIYTMIGPDRDVSPQAFHWQKGLNEEEIDDLAAELLEKMTLDEKIDQMAGEGIGRMIATFVFEGHPGPTYSGTNERLDIPPISFTDGPRGVIIGRSTSFPVAMARAATWDVELEERVGDAIGKEARALGANYFGGVCINLLRHPSNGRAQESYGEDPWLVGEMAVALLKAVQAHNVMACAKHFALNSMETSRFGIDVQLDERALREVYLPHFKKCVDNGVASIMSAYNKVRGEYCGHNRYLLTTVLRDDWGFKGFVTSDWFYGLRDGVKGVKAGMDVEMPMATHYGDNLRTLITNGEVTEAEIDQIVFRILRTKLLFATREDRMEYSADLVACRQHTELAREVAEKSMVLLQNEGALLPLSRETVKRIAVIGELSDADNTGDRGSSAVYPPYLVTPLAGLQSYLGDGVEVLHSDGRDLDEVRRLTSSVDTVLVIAGYRESEEGEFINSDGSKPNGPEEKVPLEIFGHRMSGGDRVPLSLKDRDLRVIDAVAGQNQRTVVTIIGGSAVTMEDWRGKVPAILMAWYFGMEGGNALPRVLFGDVNPSGRLPFTIPTEESQLPPFDEFADSVEYGYYHGYTLYDKEGFELAFPFGYGLSYTTFAYENLKVLTPEVPEDGTLRVSVDVANAGEVAGNEVVQLYIGFENSAVDRPVKLLRAFKKIHLAPSQVETVDLEVKVSDLAWFNPDPGRWEIEDIVYGVLVGPSSRQSGLLRDEFVVVGPK